MTPTRDATSPYLNRPVRSEREAVLEVQVADLEGQVAALTYRLNLSEKGRSLAGEASAPHSPPPAREATTGERLVQRHFNVLQKMADRGVPATAMSLGVSAITAMTLADFGYVKAGSSRGGIRKLFSITEAGRVALDAQRTKDTTP